MPTMNLKILLPFRVFARTTGVTRIIAESASGSFGILPHRLDCVAVMVPGILIFETESGGESFVAIDEGILVKTGNEVHISVRNAISGTDMYTLREVVEQGFLMVNEQEKNVRSVLAKLESGFIRRFAALNHE